MVSLDDDDDFFFQDALTDLTGDSERLPVEEQHGTWLGHKVSHILAYRSSSISFYFFFF